MALYSARQEPFRKTPYSLPAGGGSTLWHSLLNGTGLSILWYPSDQARGFISAYPGIPWHAHLAISPPSRRQQGPFCPLHQIEDTAHTTTNCLRKELGQPVQLGRFFLPAR